MQTILFIPREDTSDEQLEEDRLKYEILFVFFSLHTSLRIFFHSLANAFLGVMLVIINSRMDDLEGLEDIEFFSPLFSHFLGGIPPFPPLSEKQTDYGVNSASCYHF